jgi:hypothetical protein
LAEDAVVIYSKEPGGRSLQAKIGQERGDIDPLSAGIDLGGLNPVYAASCKVWDLIVWSIAGLMVTVII